MRFITTLLLVSFFLFSCESEKETPENISILIGYDLSLESLKDFPSDIFNHDKTIQYLNDYSQIDNHLNVGIDFTFFVINDKYLNTVQSLHLKKGSFHDNIIIRKKEVDDFKEQLKTALYSIDSLNIGSDRTRLYKPLCNCINDLAAIGNNRNLVVLYSDLLENGIVSFYDTDLDYDSIKEKLEKECQLRNLQNTHIQVISKATEKNEQVLENAESFWKQFFEEKGATFKMSANL